MTAGAYCAIYDFQLMPFALGDVLTWNVHSAIRCEQLGRESVDTFICLDERFPASLFQRDFVTPENSGLLFNELFGAFGTHPRPGAVHFYRRREPLLARLRELAIADAAIADTVDGYQRALADRKEGETLASYFRENAYSHQHINAFFAERGTIPLLRPSLGCEPDVEGLLGKRFAGKRIVPIHVRLRRLDVGYGGHRGHARDSDFLEWYEFLQAAGKKHPDVQFVALGRMQEKPLDLLALPNVVSLRAWGLGLGHELTLMLKSDLFIGASSGFAAMAYFSRIPYAITRMTQGACDAYSIEFGATRFPFGTERQVLVYEPETRELLMQLLERGLAGVPPRSGAGPVLDETIDVRSWDWERSQWLHPGSTTSRFFADPVYADKETAFLVWPRVKEARAARSTDDSWKLLDRIEAAFPRMAGKYPEFLRLRGKLAGRRGERAIERSSQERLARLDNGLGARPLGWLERRLRWGYPLRLRIKDLWRRKHRLPHRIARIFRRAGSTMSRT